MPNDSNNEKNKENGHKNRKKKLYGSTPRFVG